MSTELASLFEDARRGPLAMLAEFPSDECLAVRRHAQREEARGALASALDAYRVALLLEPTEPSAWSGAARCLRHSGDGVGAALLERTAAVLRERAR